MDRISALGYVTNPVTGKREFVNESLATGVNGTDVDATWLTGVQDEPCNVIEMAGLVCNAADNTQLQQAISLIGTRVELYTSAAAGASIWTVPPGIYRLRIKLWGAGGGGGGCNSATGCAVGGGGGGYVESTLSVSPGEAVAVALGAAGAGGSAGGSNGTSGGQTTVSLNGNLLFSANGGNGGAASTGGVTTGGAQGGAGADNTGSALYALAGQSGAPGLQGTNAFYGGQGGACPFGGGIGRTSNVGTISDAGQYPGGGGNGAGEVATGGNGAAARVEIWY